MSRKDRLLSTLSEAILCEHLSIDDESSGHQVPAGAETHFKVVMVSEAFTGLSRVARHRLINGLCDAERASGLHALSLHLYTPDEWKCRSQQAPDSPACSRARHKSGD
ncbi:regulator of penicillin binding proteins and beta lactamase transcription (morphogene) [Legionella geestiana]|uniref:Regulator of penicillin binding proteins and beta lactamase transcription (Morphogene) n=1 Tax=Legionella geestiana TaxID=45065 RepID=A0A0W0U8F3_9GAMM|nr:BolA family protein [Legionella geestiana]KTD04058.1 regulator of penicillin binding proteins and beta lactamase transcription (morphogene) [Legionella geestiana]QBS12072.1 BolA family transcriptional regulator [Legionella geestiana]QDQ40321.1 BolA family transcriptional regulator [Legionella geestiana]STX53207.1 regulator of penicillin binding proteins and beta lactamase transcription (morphogene) [Legionella geestiana]